jgi:hypothetical protein
MDEDKNINKHISLNVCIDGIIIYADLKYDDNGNRQKPYIYPITHCRDFRSGDSKELAPSPICDSKECPQKCPFNDWNKEQKVLDDYGDKLEQCLIIIEKSIYG